MRRFGGDEKSWKTLELRHCFLVTEEQADQLINWGGKCERWKTQKRQEVIYRAGLGGD